MGPCNELSQPTVLPVETQVVAVTLYPDQATVTRQGQIALAPGKHTLSFAGLPNTLQPNSVRLAGADTTRLYLCDVTVQPLPRPAAEAQESSLTKAVQALDREYHRAQDSLSRLHLQRDFLHDLAQRSPRTFALGLAQHQTSLEETEALLAYLGRAYEQIQDAIAQTEAHKRTVDHQLQAARRALETFRLAPLPGYQVLVQVETAASDTYAFDLVYTVGGVRWQIEYQARLTTADATLLLTRLATVEQTSGEDWTDVALQLVAGPPAAATPETALSPWPLSLPPQLPGKDRPSFQRSPSLEEAYRMLGAVPGSEMPLLERGGLSQTTDRVTSILPRIRLTPTGSFTVPHRPQPTTLVLDSQCLAGELAYLALPQASVHPYVQGTFFPPLASLLPGTIKLFRDGAYLGETQLPGLSSGQPLILFFGREDQIRLAHQLTLHTRTPNIHRQETLGYTISLTNTGNRPQTCLVKVQIPVSQQDQIQVSLTQATPEASLLEKGYCGWSITLEAQSQQQIQYQFTVVGPEDALIMGLDG